MTPLPRQVLVAPLLEHHELADPSAVLRQRLDGDWPNEDWRGRRVAVAVGSRGIDRIGEIARTVVAWLKARGADPFVVPAMGSHGGATPDGQRAMLGMDRALRRILRELHDPLLHGADQLVVP